MRGSALLDADYRLTLSFHFSLSISEQTYATADDERIQVGHLYHSVAPGHGMLDGSGNLSSVPLHEGSLSSFSWHIHDQRICHCLARVIG